MKTNSRLIPVLAIPTSFGYQIKVKEAAKSRPESRGFASTSRQVTHAAG